MKRALVLVLSLLVAGVAFAGQPKYVCWDGSVVKQAKQCPPFKIPLVCPDGKVVTNPAECPPIRICLDGTVTGVDQACPPPPITDPVVSE